MSKFTFIILLALTSSKLTIAKIVASSFELDNSPNKQEFVIPDYLKEKVNFWYKVYSHWESHEVVFHDTKTMYPLYVLELPKKPGQISQPFYQDQVNKVRSEIIMILESLAQNETPNTSNNALLESVIQNVSLDALVEEENISHRVRAQSGLKNQFKLGLELSGKYYDEIVSLIAALKMPQELVTIVFIESLFYATARSHKGAGGLWGFMPQTASLFGIYITEAWDERYDHLLATWAACNYLKKSQEHLKEWSLAITSYNYGLPGMIRASSNLETNDLGEIIEKHESPYFGFASTNYFAQFLAAKLVLDNQSLIFPNVKKSSPISYDIVEIERPLILSDLYKYDRSWQRSIGELNLALSTKVIKGQEMLPAGYVLRVPKGKEKDFYATLKKIPHKDRVRKINMISTQYQSSGKETLAQIARQFSVSLDFLTNGFKKTANYTPEGIINIRSRSHLFNPLKSVLGFLKQD